MFVYVYCYEKFDSSYWVEGFYILNIRWVFCFSELFFELKVMDKIMFCFIILKFFEIIFVVFIMLKMNVVIKEIEIIMMVFLFLMIFFWIWLMNVDKKIVFKYVKRNIIF